jgi:hypothetical protein
MLTLYVVPVAYVFLDGVRQRVARRAVAPRAGLATAEVD